MRSNTLIGGLVFAAAFAAALPSQQPHRAASVPKVVVYKSPT